MDEDKAFVMEALLETQLMREEVGSLVHAGENRYARACSCIILVAFARGADRFV